MKDFVFGFMSCFIFFIVALFVRESFCLSEGQGVNYSDPVSVQIAIDSIFRDLQPIEHTVLSKIPSPAELRPGQFVIYSSGTLTTKAFFKINNSTYSVALSSN